MKRTTTRKKAARKREGSANPRFPGIVAACAALGCSRTHLYYVLTGQRESRSLVRRYRELSHKEG